LRRIERAELEAFVLMPLLAPQLADHLDVGIVLERDGAAFRPVDFRSRALLSVDDQHLPFSARLLILTPMILKLIDQKRRAL
jgi:hypothetical protein